MKPCGGLRLEQGVCWIPGGVGTKQPITGLHPAVHMALASVAGCQCSAHEGYQAILAGTGDPPAVAKGRADLKMWLPGKKWSRCVHTGVEKPRQVFNVSMKQLNHSTSHVCANKQSCWEASGIKNTLKCQFTILHGQSSATAAQLVPCLPFMGCSQALPDQDRVLMLRTLGHRGAGLKPLPHFTQAVEQPSAGNDFHLYWPGQDWSLAMKCSVAHG